MVRVASLFNQLLQHFPRTELWVQDPNGEGRTTVEFRRRSQRPTHHPEERPEANSESKLRSIQTSHWPSDSSLKGECQRTDHRIY